MLKQMLAAAITAALLTSSAQAWAGTGLNGSSLQGLSYNGQQLQGLSYNGQEPQGLSYNGTQPHDARAVAGTAELGALTLRAVRLPATR